MSPTTNTHDVAVWGQFSRLEVTKTTFQDSFRPYTLEWVPPCPVSHPPRKPFQGTSTYHDTYLPHPLQEPHKPIPFPEKKHTPFEGCSTTHEAFQPHEMNVQTAAIGVGTAGGLLTTLINPNAVLPAEGSLIFTTTNDKQDILVFRIYKGNSIHTKYCREIGTLEIQLPEDKRQKAGEVRVRVGLRLLQDGSLKGQVMDMSGRVLLARNFETTDVVAGTPS